MIPKNLVLKNDDIGFFHVKRKVVHFNHSSTLTNSSLTTVSVLLMSCPEYKRLLSSGEKIEKIFLSKDL